MNTEHAPTFSGNTTLIEGDDLSLDMQQVSVLIENNTFTLFGVEQPAPVWNTAFTHNVCSGAYPDDLD